MKKTLFLISAIAALAFCFHAYAHDEHHHDCSKNESQEVYDCKRCNGTGVDPLTYPCSSCGGQKVITKIINCPTCNGKGTIKDRFGDDQKCPECDGARKILDKKTCSKCGGTGEEKRPCRNCNGTGKVER